VDYFPQRLRAKYTVFMAKHALRRDIIATVLANTMINRTGSVYVHRMQEETGAAPEEVTRAFILVRDVFDLEPLWADIDAPRQPVPAQLQYEMLENVGRLVVRATLWFLRRRREKLPIGEVLKIFRPRSKRSPGHAGAARSRGPHRMDAMVGQAHAAGRAAGARRARREPRRHLRRARRDRGLGEQKKPVDVISTLYFALGGELDLRWISERISLLPTDTSWQALARNALRDDLASQHRAVTAAVAKLSHVGSRSRAHAAGVEGALRTRDRAAQVHDRGPAARERALDLAVMSVLLRS
jgi:glutamate dehydrogenase